MEKEWKWKSKSGRAFFHAGIGQQDAVGTPHPGHDMPLGEGARLLLAKGVDNFWLLALVLGVFRALVRRRKRR